MRVVIVGGSTGIGRDIQPPLRTLGHEVSAMARDEWHPPEGTQALLFCQRGRQMADDWTGEIEATLTRTKQIMERLPSSVRAVVMLASVAAVSVEDEQPVSYHVCKAGLLAMMRYYAVRLGRQGVRVNAIIPALTIKPEARPFYEAHPELEDVYTLITPLERMGRVQDLAHAVEFLISKHSSYLTGQTLTLDGGIGLRSAWAVARRVHPDLRGLSVTQRKDV